MKQWLIRLSVNPRLGGSGACPLALSFVSDEQLTDSVYQNVYVDVHEAIIPTNVEIKVKHKKYTRITGPFRTESGGRFSIKPY